MPEFLRDQFYDWIPLWENLMSHYPNLKMEFHMCYNRCVLKKYNPMSFSAAFNHMVRTIKLELNRNEY